MSRVVVAMSGGVDSSVAAALMIEQGHEVSGLTMVITGDDPSTDPAAGQASRVCAHLGIPHETVDAREVFELEVVTPFVAEYAAGRTPNPCVLCNASVKFGWLYDRARAAGAEYLATGHYARIVREPGGTTYLARAAHGVKDQSYFLYAVGPGVLGHTLLPLGELDKPTVRRLALESSLPTAKAAESQDMCFVGHEGHGALIAARVPQASAPGPIVDRRGEHLGIHRGLAHYTVGQRKGLGIAAHEPLYVLEIVPAKNTLVVGTEGDLDVREIVAANAVWHAGPDRVACEVQTRYRMRPVPARATRDRDALDIELETPVAGVAPGQAVVCYEGDRVLGGGVIVSAR